MGSGVAAVLAEATVAAAVRFPTNNHHHHYLRPFSDEKRKGGRECFTCGMKGCPEV